MYKLRRLKTTGILALSVAMGGTMVACSSTESTTTDDSAEQTTEAVEEDTEESTEEEADKTESGVAATVNGEAIDEDTVTKYVEDFRESQGLEDDDSWANWMIDNMYTPETVRQDVIDYYAEDILLHQAAEEYDVTVDQDEVDDRVAQVRDQFESEEDWQSALEEANFTEQEYAETVIEPAIIQEKLSEVVAEDQGTNEATDDDIVAMAQQYEDLFDGARRSSHILFMVDSSADEDAQKEVEEKAQEVLDQINDGDITFEEAVEQYSEDTGSAAQEGDVGWDIFISSAGPTDSFVTDYQDAVGELEVDEISDLVKSDYGYHIIKCTDIYEVPAGGIESVDDIPEDFVDQIAAQIEYMAGDVFLNWFDEYEQNADIVVNPMPEGLSYDIDLSAYETAPEEDEALLEDALISSEDAAQDAATAEDEAADDDAEAADEAEDAAEENVQDAEADEDEAATKASDK